MKNKGLFGTVAAAILVIVLIVALIVVLFITKNYVVVGTQLFPKGKSTLDLRDRAITVEEYDALGRKIPQAEILWSVPLSSGYFDSSSEEIQVSTFHSSDADLLAYFPNLKVVNAQSCTDYAALRDAYVRYSDITFDYTVPIAGEEYTPGAVAVTLESLDQADLQMLEMLPNLKKIDAVNCRSYDLLHQLQQSHPEWEISCRETIAGTKISEDTEVLTVTGAEYNELSVGLAAMPNLKSLTIHDPAATGDELTALRDEYPDVDIHWEVTIFENTFSDDAVEVDISNQPIGSIEEAKRIGGLFPSLQKLIVDSTGIENEDMAAYREEVRSKYKVVWTVIMTEKCKARTDDTKFMPIDQGEYYFQDDDGYNLRYCEDMVCIDIGHSTVENIDFVAFMPHLKYLILAWTQVKNITAISNCKELIYLELDHGIVHDFTPLLGCTALEDLNISDHMWDTDLTPISQMTWLKNLFATDHSYANQQLLIESLPDTRVVTTATSTASGNGWRNLQNYYDMRDYLGKPYMD